jgi:hypothetical protein
MKKSLSRDLAKRNISQNPQSVQSHSTHFIPAGKQFLRSLARKKKKKKKI